MNVNACIATLFDIDNEKDSEYNCRAIVQLSDVVIIESCCCWC